VKDTGTDSARPLFRQGNLGAMAVAEHREPPGKKSGIDPWEA
jgi:hypothetical protein